MKVLEKKIVDHIAENLKVCMNLFKAIRSHLSIKLNFQKKYSLKTNAGCIRFK